MLISVIIPTFKRREALIECLKRLAPDVQNISSELYEVIVTDDAFSNEPNDGLSQEYPWIIHKHGPQKGPASNRNNGARFAQGEWLLFVDDDCLPQPSCLSAYIEAINQNPECYVFEGRTLTERPKMRLDEEAPINEKGGLLWSCNFLIKRILFFEIGGFCELYRYACMEDVDFREQLKARNLKFLFVPKASVIHPWRTFSSEMAYMKSILISHAIFQDRYPLLKPSFFSLFCSILREWYLNLAVDGPRLKFRGFWRICVKLSLSTLSRLLTYLGFGRKRFGI